MGQHVKRISEQGEGVCCPGSDEFGHHGHACENGDPEKPFHLAMSDRSKTAGCVRLFRVMMLCCHGRIIPFCPVGRETVPCSVIFQFVSFANLGTFLHSQSYNAMVKTDIL